MLAFFIRGGAGAALTAVASLGLSALAVLLGVVALYGWLLRVMTPASLSRVTAFIGVLGLLLLMAMSMVAFVQLTDHLVGDSISLDAGLSGCAWTLLLPATWFASYLPVAFGEGDRLAVMGCALSIVALAGLAMALRGRMAFEYADGVMELAIDPSRGSERPRSTPAFLTRERRAIVLLVLAHLRADIAFQTGMLIQVVMGGLLLGVAFFGGLPEDPFFRTGAAAPETMFYLVLIFLGTSAYQSITVSAEHQASWFFFTTPSDRVRQVLAARDAVMAVMVLPPLAVMAGFLTYAYGHAGHALLHALFFGGIAYLMVQMAVALKPRIPFSVPATGRRGGAFGGAGVVIGGAAGMIAALLLHLFAFPTPAGVLVGLASLAAAIILVNRLTRSRIMRQADAVTYFG